MPDNTRGKAQCRYRRCRRWLPKHTGQGRRAEFCNAEHRRRERTARELDQTPPKPSRATPSTRSKSRQCKPGDRWGQLVLVEYIGKAKGGTQARFACDCGATKILRLSNVRQGPTSDCADRTAHPHPCEVEAPSINRAHARVVKARGSAKVHRCVRCGAQAEHWAYRHSALDPLMQLDGKDKGQVYSIDPADYWALCRGCHKRFDAAHERMAIPAGQVSGIHHALTLAFNPYGDGTHVGVFELDDDPLTRSFTTSRKEAPNVSGC